VHVEGRSTIDWDSIALRRRIGYVLQEVGLFPHLNVHENISLVAHVDGWTTARIAARVDELLDLVGLPRDLGSRWIEQVSGGQRQRVGVARALMLDPPILLMDEPFGALDPITRVELHSEVHAIQARIRKTIVIVTHDLREGLALADEIGVLDGGRLVCLGHLDALHACEHPFVRELLRTLEVKA
jgi:osmoprotectant transport system ATP-binding protein